MYMPLSIWSDLIYIMTSIHLFIREIIQISTSTTFEIGEISYTVIVLVRESIPVGAISKTIYYDDDDDNTNNNNNRTNNNKMRWN